jgi:ubiquinone/menaquinone biosynthesis C-methylase UbiE
MNDAEKLAHDGLSTSQRHAQQGWQRPEAAAAYRRSRDPSRFHRHHREEAILSAWMQRLPGHAVILDVPCGTGRMVPTVTGRRFRYIGGDISLAMIGEARGAAGSEGALGFVNANAEQLPFADQSVDCVIVWRLLHHIRESSVRVAILREAARVSRLLVFLSFHHPFSFTHWRKVIKRTIVGGIQHGSTITEARLDREAAQCGLRLEETKGFRKFVSINWFACLSKTETPKPERGTRKV